jgi:chemotaxis protein methyltransferase CheR
MVLGNEIEDLEIRYVIDAIHRRYGYDFREYERDSMRRRIRSALAKSDMTNLGELQHRVLTCPEYFVALLDDLTVQVSEFFRDPGMQLAFRNDVCPVLRTYPQLKIWLAGCASGEEIYSTAIILEEEGLYDRAQIYATDVSVGALGRAKEGVYAERLALQAEDAYQRSGGKNRFRDYFSQAYGNIRLRESLRRNVTFFQHDLVTDYALGEMQVIFCRNVLIYFDVPLRTRVVSMFTRGLSHGGFLCLGQSECLPAAVAAEFGEFSTQERIYRYRRHT